MELIKRYNEKLALDKDLPRKAELIEVFSDFYFGGDPDGDVNNWKGFICNERLLVSNNFFNKLSSKGFLYGFLSGAERPSAKFVLEERLKLKNPALIAMGESPEKPNPNGLLALIRMLTKQNSLLETRMIAYLGDTVADILTVKNAQKILPKQKLLSLGVAPPHLHEEDQSMARKTYEKELHNAGADKVLYSTEELVEYLESIY